MKNLSIADKNHIEYTKMKLKELLEKHTLSEYMKGNENVDYMIHVILHRQAFSKIELHTEYHGKFSEKHDVDKVGMALILGREDAKRIHKLTALHHTKGLEENNEDILAEKIIDWESCHYTKIKSQKTAYEYLITEHKDKEEQLKPIMQKLGIWEERNTKPLTKEAYDAMVKNVSIETIETELKKSYNYLCDLTNEVA